MANPSTRHRTQSDRRFFREPAEREPGPARLGADPPATKAPSAREQVSTASGLNVLAGVWLIIAPFVLGYGHGDPYWNDIVFGAIVAAIGAGRLIVSARHAWMSWLNMIIGAWVFASAFWLDQTARAGWNDVILGIIVFLLGGAAASAAGARMADRRAPDAT
jgi:hypothetical protein